MKLQVIIVIVFITSAQTNSIEPSSWAKQLIKSVKEKITHFWTTNQFNGTKPQPPLTSIVREEPKQTKFNTFYEKARRIKKLVIDHIKPDDKGRNPGVFMTTPQLIAIHDYPAESHTIATEDGYLLTVHRIPYSKKRPRTMTNGTVLLHHGLLGSSADWVLAGPEKSLAYILADYGYDVWMANVRGNSYSRAHRTKDPNSFAFWNFTFHEVGQYDVPAVIDYIKHHKGDCNLHYIGHSMGTTVLFALLSTKPKYNHELTSAIALAPVAFMSKIRSPIRLLAKYASNINFLLKLFSANEFLPRNDVLRWLSENMCNVVPKAICENVIFVLCGHDDKQFNKTLLPMILGHVPAGASTLTLVHYAQEIRDGGRFQYFDYGRNKNYEVYGTKTPPAYPVENITLPISLMSAKNDWLAGEDDVSTLFSKLQNVSDHYIVPYQDFNHIDFLWGSDAPTLVYARVLQQLRRFERKITGPLSVRESNKILMQEIPKVAPVSKVAAYASKVDYGPKAQLQNFATSNNLLNELGLNAEMKEELLFNDKEKYRDSIIGATTKENYVPTDRIFPAVDENRRQPAKENNIKRRKNNFVESSMAYNQVYPAKVVFKTFF